MSNQRRNRVSSSFVHYWIAFSLLSASSCAWAQFSRDGNRWYEVEISIFAHERMPSASPEETLPERVNLGYPERLRTLESPLQALAYDFAPAEPEPLTALFPELLEPTRPMAGPPPAPSSSRGFRLPDFNSDPYLRVEGRAGQFDRHNDRLRRSPDHRLLYHAAWRQPVFNRPQAEAILVTGGERHGQHHELEGSVMFSFNVNRIDLDARLWLAGFQQVMPAWDDTRENGEEEAPRWELPDVPFRETAEAPETGPGVVESGPDAGMTGDNRFPPFSARGRSFRPAMVPVDTVIELGYLEQRRSMISDQLHYLDHPRFGILVEVRPYELPDPLGEDDLP